MKFSYVFAGFGVLVLILLVSGCTSTSQAQAPTYTYTPTVSLPPVTPSPTPVPFPNALAVNQFDQFGSGGSQGEVTVYGYKELSNYNWTSPQYNSNPYQQIANGPNLENGYTTVTPAEGNTFLIVFVRFINTGTTAISAPSAGQFYVYSNGISYNTSIINVPQVTLSQVSGTPYADLVGAGGTGASGDVQPGQSNGLDGYLIFEIPDSFTPSTTYVTLNYENQPSWVLG
jgi:hypothetical protein